MTRPLLVLIALAALLTGCARTSRPRPGIITTVAGTDRAGYSGDGGPATQASLNEPCGIAVGPDGCLYIADSGNSRLRKVDQHGIITTVVGNGQFGCSGDGGPATKASLDYVTMIAVGPDYSLYRIADILSNRVRKIAPTGMISTVAGNGRPGCSGDGGPAVGASLGDITGIAVGADGSLYIADLDNHRIRRVDSKGIITTVAGNGRADYAGDGGPATKASLYGPLGLAIGKDGSLFIADGTNYRIRRIDPKGTITTVAGNGEEGWSGDGGPATKATLFPPNGIVVCADGSLLIACGEDPRVRRVAPNGVISTLPGNGVMGAEGDIAVGADGLYIADSANHRIRMVTGVAPPASP